MSNGRFPSLKRLGEVEGPAFRLNGADRVAQDLSPPLDAEREREISSLPDKNGE